MKRILILIVGALMLCQYSYAYNFYAQAPSGQTLYYNIVNGKAEVTYQNTNEPYYSTYPTGSLTIPSSVTYNGTTYSVTSIGTRAFYDCSGLTSVTIPSSVTAIGSKAFQRCSGLASVTIPNSVKYIGEWSFSICSSLDSITIPNSVTTISDETFYGCSELTCITIPSSVTNIGNEAFGNCRSLTSVTIPDGVTVIKDRTFSGCSGLSSVTIGSGVTSIKAKAFEDCGLTEIKSRAIIAPSLDTSSFDGVPSAVYIYIPCGSKLSYTYNLRWTYFSNFIEDDRFVFSVTSSDSTQGQVTIITSPTCQVPIAEFYAIANSGYLFDHWSDGNTNNPRYLPLSSDTSIIAMFASTHSVNVSNALGGGEYVHGSTATLVALPQVGLQFYGWSDGETVNPRNIVVTSDTTLTALYRIPDTIHIYDTTTVYDTVINIVYDTTEYNHYYYDTTRVYDTLVIYDTLVYINIDTLHNYYYDTTRIFDTMVYVNVDTLNHYYYQYDTTRVYDTLVKVNIDTLNHYYYQYDTTWVFDTMVYVNIDTLNHYYYDTTAVTHFIFDSTWVFDTIYFFDTVYIHDTIVVGVDKVETIQAKVYVSQGQVVVEGADGNTVTLYDVNGRVLATKQDNYMPLRFDAPASGTYLIKIGNHPARRVVVIK